MRLSHSLFRVAITVILVLVFAEPAHAAYLDPGSGSFLFQLLIASLLGGLFLLKNFWKRSISFFRRSSSAKQTTPSSNTTESTDATDPPP